MGSGAHARGVAGGWLIGAATAVVLLGASIAPFLTPAVVRFEQDRTGAGELTGVEAAQLDAVTSALLGDLVLWRGDFDVALGPAAGGPVLSEAERSHMRDVRTVFTGFWLVVLAGVAVVAMSLRRARGAAARSAAWRSIRNGARVLAVAIVVAGAFAIVAFDTAFEIFHRLFFSAGTYTFDPATDRLVQLFPERFWSEITIAVGGVALVLAGLASWQAGRNASRASVVD